MKKKNIATVMASTMAMASVMPVFAAQESVKTVPVNVRTANGETLVINENNDIERKLIEDEGTVKAAKEEMNKVVAELEKMSKDTYKVIEKDEEGNDKVVVKNTYDIKIDEKRTIKSARIEEAIDATSSKSIIDNQLVVVATNNETKKVTEYIFKGLKRLDLDMNFGNGEAKVEKITINLADETQYEAMTELQYNLEKNLDKIKVDKEKFTNSNQINGEHNLKLVVSVNGVKLAEITLENVQSLNTDKYVSMPVNGDVTGHWAEETVLKAMVNKWVDASATFRPQDSITRAEFVKVVNRAFGIETTIMDRSLSNEFADVKAEDWYYEDVKAAARFGYINGYEDGTFRPDQPITRQEAAKIIAKLTNGADVEEVAGEDINGNEIQKDTKTKFADDADIAVWADESVELLTKTGVITGYEDNTFKPAGNITRAEAVVMMFRGVGAPTPLTK